MKSAIGATSSRTTSVLNTILGEVPSEVFLTKHLGKRFLPLPGPAARFSTLLTWDDLNYILETQMFTAATIRLKKAGVDVPIDSFLKEVTRTRTPDVSTRISARVVTRELRDGATLIINEIQNPWPPIAELANDLQVGLQARVNVNMYASLHESHGFPIHYDSHDVLILQTQGRKHWQVFERRPVTPFPDEPFQPHERPHTGTPLWDEILTQGDALYMPRGVWHFAKPIGEPTIHLTIGIVRPTGREFVNWVVQRLTGTELLRSDIPLFEGRAAQLDFLESCRTALHAALADDQILTSYFTDRTISDGASGRQRFALPWSATDRVLPDEGIIYLGSPDGVQPYDIPGTPGIVRIFVDGKPGPEMRSAVVPLCAFLSETAPITMSRFFEEFAHKFDGNSLRAFLRELAASGAVCVKARPQSQSAEVRDYN